MTLANTRVKTSWSGDYAKWGRMGKDWGIFQFPPILFLFPLNLRHPLQQILQGGELEY